MELIVTLAVLLASGQQETSVWGSLEDCLRAGAYVEASLPAEAKCEVSISHDMMVLYTDPTTEPK